MLDTAELKERLKRFLRRLKFYTGQCEKSEWRRKSFRFIWQVPAEVEVLGSGQISEPVHVWTGTISADGMDFLSPAKLKRGQKVMITFQAYDSQVHITGNVVHSTDLFSKDKVGVEFDQPDSQDSSEPLL